MAVDSLLIDGSFPVALSLFSVIFSFLLLLFLQICYSFMSTYKKGSLQTWAPTEPGHGCFAELGARLAIVLLSFLFLFDNIHQQQHIASLQQSPLTEKRAQRIHTTSE